MGLHSPSSLPGLSPDLRVAEGSVFTPSFVGMHYTDHLIALDLTFIQGRSKETRLGLLKDFNTRVAAAASVSPDDTLITPHELPGENISFGQGEAQRANATAGAESWMHARVVGLTSTTCSQPFASSIFLSFFKT